MDKANMTMDMANMTMDMDNMTKKEPETTFLYFDTCTPLDDVTPWCYTRTEVDWPCVEVDWPCVEVDWPCRRV